jgi:homoserine acetyltransferase
MADPNWNRGFYYDALPPHAGMKLARRASCLSRLGDPRTEHSELTTQLCQFLL